MATKADAEAADKTAATGMVAKAPADRAEPEAAGDVDGARTVALPTVTGCDCVRCRMARGEEPEISAPGGLVTDGSPTSD